MTPVLPAATAVQNCKGKKNFTGHVALVTTVSSPLELEDLMRDFVSLTESLATSGG